MQVIQTVDDESDERGMRCRQKFGGLFLAGAGTVMVQITTNMGVQVCEMSDSG